MFHYVGTRTTGDGAGNFLITGPGFKGRVPAGMRRIRSSYERVWLVGRTLVYGPRDLPAVHRIQNGYRLIPLSDYVKRGLAWHPPRPRHVVTHHRVATEPTGLKFFDQLGTALAENPPPRRDARILKQLRQVGIGPGLDPPEHLTAPVIDGLKAAAAGGPDNVSSFRTRSPRGRCWPTTGGSCQPFENGQFGIDYLPGGGRPVRDAANRPQEALYIVGVPDSISGRLSGLQDYVLHFPAGQLPPARYFWSLTMYNQGFHLVSNPIGRYALGSHSPGTESQPRRIAGHLFPADRTGRACLQLAPCPTGPVRGHAAPVRSRTLGAHAPLRLPPDRADQLISDPGSDVAAGSSGPVVALRFENGVLWALDQTRLPWHEVELPLRSATDVAAAIRRLSIRGAPLIGVAAGYGLALELARAGAETLASASELLVSSRPTAVNLAHAVNRVAAAARGVVAGGDVPGTALAEARAIHAEEINASHAVGRLGADFLAGPDPGGGLGAQILAGTDPGSQHGAGSGTSGLRLLTHCNTGALAAPGRGTALAVIAELADRGRLALVLTAETRPLLQGARLTTYELRRLGIEHELIVDGAAAGLIAAGEVDAVVLGCDRVAANGDVANKVGTYAHALAAAAAGIPFVVAGPCSTIDPRCPSGAEIVVERRSEDEVRRFGAASGPSGFDVAPSGTRCRNPAFDVTPAALVTALVTERGVVRPAAGELGALAAAVRPVTSTEP